MSLLWPLSLMERFIYFQHIIIQEQQVNILKIILVILQKKFKKICKRTETIHNLFSAQLQRVY